MCPEFAEPEYTYFYLLAQCPVNARMGYAPFGTPKISERDIKTQMVSKPAVHEENGRFNSYILL